jgi:hypothetical protein
LRRPAELKPLWKRALIEIGSGHRSIDGKPTADVTRPDKALKGLLEIDLDIDIGMILDSHTTENRLILVNVTVPARSLRRSIRRASDWKGWG